MPPSNSTPRGSAVHQKSLGAHRPACEILSEEAIGVPVSSRGHAQLLPSLTSPCQLSSMSTVSPNGACTSRVGVAKSTGYEGSGGYPPMYISVRTIEHTGSIPDCSTHSKLARRSVPPPPRILKVISSSQENSSTPWTIVSQ